VTVPEADMEFDIPPERLIGGDTAAFTFATSGYVDFVRNLHESLRRADPWLARSLIVFCADAPTAEALEAAGMFAIDCGVGDLPDFAEFEGPGFGRVMSHKWLLARRLLRQVEYAWWCDGDIVVLAPLVERIRSLMRDGDCDLLMQREWPYDVLNAGFWVARRSAAVDAVLAEMAEHSAGGADDDQAYFNERQAGRDDLRVCALDHDEFTCGNRFYFQGVFRRPPARLLHFNYSVGRQTKKSLMMGLGCWYLPEPRSARRRARLWYSLVTVLNRAGVPEAEQTVERAGAALASARAKVTGR
jgi:hypothetical protein